MKLREIRQRLLPWLRSLRPEMAIDRGEEVYLLVIDHKRGTDISAHRTAEGAANALRAYCADWWDKESGGKPRPSDNDLIDSYFTETDYSENYEITSCGRLSQ